MRQKLQNIDKKNEKQDKNKNRIKINELVPFIYSTINEKNKQKNIKRIE